ncbi:TlyA family RNA methyltransferase [Terriglobus roseus]|uniref:23S rRNA (Cytidine1920-2'-O)/16S rRNA (Cytidine1409-2'-O)-methyltransferase n=1 Tax=Terriglobus roseus TaxID=392734 RepID=A0A1H4TQT6_9BACT|nr:TlyA family RNA methyltransferase [Terriglobus roseus]SEC58815.1 23S rRNA (cytidine1920-2'-O)/16S rRNA (cytidine1409-2'-O)-methyltransferase [Terriglobus roseus]
MAKQRLDKVMVERGMVPSRERATGLILAGRVLVAEQKLTKAGAAVDGDVAIRILGEGMPFVSRGGLKLRGALDRWDIDLRGRLCVDIGASTGGFTDCMLQAGAAAVLAVDTGYGQMHMSMRNDARVGLMERTNARLLEPGVLLTQSSALAQSATPALAPDVAPSFFAMDVSFISATLVVPAVVRSLAPAEQQWRGEAVTLVKPQFEAGREWVGKGGIVRDPAAYEIAIDRVRGAVAEAGGVTVDVTDSPITGAEGNREFLLYARFGG